MACWFSTHIWSPGPIVVMGSTMKIINRFLKNKSGATAIEYGLIAALIAVAVIGGVSQLGTNANKTFTTVADKMS